MSSGKLRRNLLLLPGMSFLLFADRSTAADAEPTGDSKRFLLKAKKLTVAAAA